MKASETGLFFGRSGGKRDPGCITLFHPLPAGHGWFLPWPVPGFLCSLYAQRKEAKETQVPFNGFHPVAVGKIRCYCSCASVVAHTGRLPGYITLFHPLPVGHGWFCPGWCLASSVLCPRKEKRQKKRRSHSTASIRSQLGEIWCYFSCASFVAHAGRLPGYVGWGSAIKFSERYFAFRNRQGYMNALV